MQRCTDPPKMGPWFHSLLWNLHKPWSPCKEDQENSCLKAPLCEIVHMWTLGMPCLVFFLGDASLTMTPCTVFPFFWFFLNSLAPLRELGQTRGAIDVCQVGWETWFGLGSRVPHPQGTSLYFSLFFWCAFLVALVQNWIKMDLGQKNSLYGSRPR
jgi:hypothetical protein